MEDGRMIPHFVRNDLFTIVILRAEPEESFPSTQRVSDLQSPIYNLNKGVYKKWQQKWK